MLSSFPLLVRIACKRAAPPLSSEPCCQPRRSPAAPADRPSRPSACLPALCHITPAESHSVTPGWPRKDGGPLLAEPTAATLHYASSARLGPARLGPARLGSARLGSARLDSTRRRGTCTTRAWPISKTCAHLANEPPHCTQSHGVMSNHKVITTEDTENAAV